MRVRLYHSRHQKGPCPVDDPCAQYGRRRLAEAGLDDAADLVALHQNIAGEGRLAPSIKNSHVGEQGIGHLQLREVA